MPHPSWQFMDPNMTPEHLGLLPYWLDTLDPRPAKDQLDSHYGHGGGWSPFQGFTMLSDDSLKYPGDPELQPLAKAEFRDETILFYRHAWVSIKQTDGSFEVCRMD